MHTSNPTFGVKKNEELDKIRFNTDFSCRSSIIHSNKHFCDAQKN
jgi:hypothetical protein